MIRATVKGHGQVMSDLVGLRLRMANVMSDAQAFQLIILNNVLLMMDRECDPDGIPWADLSPTYAAWKAGYAPGAEMGYLDGPMKRPANIMGIAVGNGTSLTVAYGVEAVAIYHATCFTEGFAVTGTNQPPRPFYALSAPAVDDVNTYIASIIGP